MSEEMSEHLCHALRTGAEMKDRKERASGDQWPARARAPVWYPEAWYEVRRVGDARSQGGGKRVHVNFFKRRTSHVAVNYFLSR